MVMHSQSGSSVPSTPTTWVTPRTQHRHSTRHAQEIASPSRRRVPYMDNLTRSTFEASPSSFPDISDENSPVIPPFEFSPMRLKQESGGPLAPLSNCALRDNSPTSEMSALPPRLLGKYSNVDSSVISPSPALTNRQLGQRRRRQREQLERAKSGQDGHVLDSATMSALFTQAVNPQPVSLSSNMTPDEQQRAGHPDSHQPEALNPAQSDDGKFDSIIASSDVLSQYNQEPTANAENSMEMGSSSSSVTLSRRQLGQRRRRERERLEHAHQSASAISGCNQANITATPYSPSAQNNFLQTHHISSNSNDTNEDHNLQQPPQDSDASSIPSVVLSRRQLGQRHRRERERLECTAIRDIVVHQHSASFTRATRHSGRNVDTQNADINEGHESLPLRRNMQLPFARQVYEEPLSRHDLGHMDIACCHCGALHWFEERVVSRSRHELPAFSLCCDHGQVSLPMPPDPPAFLKYLFSSSDLQATEFRTHIRQYNASLAFTSLGVALDQSINAGGRAQPIIRIHGEICHHHGSLLPEDGRTPAYAQLYIYDPQYALDQRMRRNTNLRRDTMESLQQLISTSHPYAGLYKPAYQILTEYAHVPDVSIRLSLKPSRDLRRYNLPTANELAVIMPGDGSDVNAGRDIVLRLNGGGLQRINDGHPAYACLHYVLFHPHGEHGWHYNLRMNQLDRENPRRLSQTDYYAYQLQMRRGQFPIILRGGRLFQQWLVDMWASAEQNRLNYLRLHQDDIRASLYSGIVDAVHDHAEDLDFSNLGRRIILPSSFTGGPRHMQQCTQDALALARYFRKIDIFMTVTCNPQWKEITRELLPGQTATDRPELVARVFEMKKKAILKDVLKTGVFGRVVAHVYSIEFQKRGLPHMHLLIFLDDPYTLRSAADIDTVIRAYWPDPQDEPLLFETVKRCMVHGPCDERCMENGKCKRGYPKPFQPFTSMDEEGYPKYYRPNDGHAFEVNGMMVDNRWIVPYNPQMSAKYDCHINVESAVSFGSVKYILKYVHKGCDRTMLEVHRMDEIKHYLDARYVSPAEASWRIFHFDVHEQEPNVVRLAIHLPGHHLVTFNPNESTENIITRAASEKTTLTGMFAINSDPQFAHITHQLTYQEFPQYFVWKQAERRWTLRKRGWALGRMYYVSPTAGERFHLRTLLTVVRRPQSFEDLRTFNGVIHPTFRDACLARGLLEDDGEWRLCLLEASTMQTGPGLRDLFATMLLFCHPSQPEVLWREFRHHICDDLAYRLRSMGREHISEEDIFDYGLFLLEKILQRTGQSLSDFPPMPSPQHDWNSQAENGFIAEQLNYDQNQELQLAVERCSQLNLEQAAAYNCILESVEQNCGKIFFLNGPGGTGKTFVYNTVCNKIRSMGWIVLCVASSGIAALLLRGGRTAHSMFKIPIGNLHDQSTCNVSKESKLADLFRMTKLIIWDEITAQDRRAPEAVDRTFRDIRNCDRPFGGVTVVFGGDFQQTLPVVVNGSREDIIAACVQRSHLWMDINILHLRTNMRLRNNTDAVDFAKWLLDIGHGRFLLEDQSLQIPEHLLSRDLSSLINYIYADIGSTPPPPPQYFMNRVILAARNSEVENINHEVLDRMSGDEKVCVSADTIVVESGADKESNLEDYPLPVEFLRTLNASGLPPGELRLKPGCPLILLRNLAPTRGLCNGTRMVLMQMSDRVLEVKLVGGDHDGEVALIPRISLTPSESHKDFAFVMRRRQFPVRLAFAMTINKAQGQSVKHVGVDLRMPVFTHGQLYVAFSRVTSSQCLKVLLPQQTPSEQGTTYNIVYPEVLVD